MPSIATDAWLTRVLAWLWLSRLNLTPPSHSPTIQAQSPSLPPCLASPLKICLFAYICINMRPNDSLAWYYCTARRVGAADILIRVKAVSRAHAIAQVSREVIKRGTDCYAIHCPEGIPVAEQKRREKIMRRKAAKEQSLTKKRNKALDYYDKYHGW